ncbi:MAG TPA: 23S rRNA (guanosine(2251)-2'-O)-methyltransferase RlmB [Stellaceae bacterium]|nr:23S rRNA (guanosine(2251)-2'-O)-methyltransferase RlmB [Stellaceae bacterium]
MRIRRSNRADQRAAAPPSGGGERWLYGRHAVAAALANPARRWRRLAVLPGQEAEGRALIAAAQAARRGDGEPLRVMDRAGFAALLGDDAVHQGLALETEPLDPPDLDDVLRGCAVAARSVVIVLDQIVDPHNVGAILRAAAAFGAAAVIVAAHGAPPATGVLAKAASGALELVPLVAAVNLARTLDRLKEAGFWCCGLDERAPHLLAALDLGPRVALVLGAEGDGLRRLVRERCDYLARLPTGAAMPSLNVSTAAAIALYALAARGN